MKRARYFGAGAAILALCGLALAAEPDSSIAPWAQKHLWAGDSAVVTDSGFTFEIHRDVSDLYLVTGKSSDADFSRMLQLHGFLYLASPLSQTLLASFPKVERIRLVLWVREKSQHEPMLKIRLNRTNYLSSHPEVIAATAPEDPDRFLKLCRKKFDGFWISGSLGE